MKPVSILLSILLIAFTLVLHAQSGYVTVGKQGFEIDGQPYHYLGTNLWYGMHLAADGSTGDMGRLTKELDSLAALGITNLRLMVGTEGPADAPYRIQPAVQHAPGVYNEALLKGLDKLLVELSKRNMKAVLCLNNFFQWTGGMAQYVSWATDSPIPYPHDNNGDWTTFQLYAAQFFTNQKALRWYKQFVKTLINRENTQNGLAYKDDPTIMAWQLANEPRGFTAVDAYVRWAEKMSKFIQRKDKHHLVSLGGEGFLPYEDIGTAFSEVSAMPSFDYLTVHLWVENWSWFQPKQPESYDAALEKATTYLDRHLPVAQRLKKPIVLEEFGMSREGGRFGYDAPTTLRDEYYTTIFNYVLEKAANKEWLVGLNFWSWSGEGKPVNPGEMWKPGDVITGDPPHELQGWYSVYTTDESTKAIIRLYASQMNDLHSIGTVVTQSNKE